MISSIQLARAGISCAVVEKKSYPFHRVCGEYVSNEAVPFLKSAGLYPEEFYLPRITSLELSSIRGKVCRIDLDLGGFGISRFSFDHFLYRKALQEGVIFMLNTEVSAVRFDGAGFCVEVPSGTMEADVVIGAFGKRSKLDVQQNRTSFSRRSPYVGVKYHVLSAHPEHRISLHNFRGGYCGVCNVDQGATNLCYLTHRDNLRKFGSVSEMERHVLFENPHLKSIFENAAFLFRKPEVINEISFHTKGPVENHMLMAGDSAGMIAPLCGNGMAIAIRSAAILSDIVSAYCTNAIDRATMESLYRRRWNELFRFRLWFGRGVQHLFGNPLASASVVTFANAFTGAAKALARNTHGQPFGLHP